MKRVWILLLSVLVLVACGSNSLVHEDFRVDLEQILEVTDAAFGENREMNEEEKNLLDRFTNKYMYGQFLAGEENYEMTDIEKEITRKAKSLYLYTEHGETLSSETTLYETSREEIDELLEMSNIPENLVNKYPVYEKQDGMHPQFEKDARELVERLVPFMDTADLNESDHSALKEFLNNYDHDGFEVDGTHYLHNDETDNIVFVLYLVNADIEEGTLLGTTQTTFYEIADDLGISY